MGKFVFLFFVLLLESQAVQGAERLSFSEYLAKVRENNLGLKIEDAKVEAADARSTGLNIPPPSVSLAQMNMASGGISQGYEINQTIPFPTKLTSDHAVRREESRSQKEMKQAVSQEILAQAKRIFLALWVAQEKLEVLKEKKEIILDHIKLSRSGVRSDSFLKLHLLKAESNLDLLENEIEASEQMLREKKAKAAEFINVDIASFDKEVSEPPVSILPKKEALTTSHQIESKKYELSAFKSLESQAGSLWLPDFNLNYKQMGPGSALGQYNQVMVGVTLPFLFFWEPYSASRSASGRRIQAELELEREKRKIETESYSYLSKTKSLKEQLETLESKLIPRAKERVKLVHNIAPRDMESLQDHLETMEALPELRSKELDLRLEYEIAVSELEKYLPESGERP